MLKRTLSVGLLVAAVLLAFLGVACDPGHSVTYENRTDESIDFFIDGSFAASIDPQDERTFSKIEFDVATFEARDSTGELVYRKTFTWEELEEAGWRVVVEPSALGPE